MTTALHELPSVPVNSGSLEAYLRQEYEPDSVCPGIIREVLHTPGEVSGYACSALDGEPGTNVMELVAAAVFMTYEGPELGIFPMDGVSYDHSGLWKVISEMELSPRLIAKEAKYFDPDRETERQEHVRSAIIPHLHRFRLPLAMIVWGMTPDMSQSGTALLHHADIRPSEALQYVKDQAVLNLEVYRHGLKNMRNINL